MRDSGTEWVGGRLLMPGYVMEGEPHRPELVLWLELPADLIVSFTLLDRGGPPVRLAESLLAATRKPMAGPPRRPRRVRVASEALAAELRGAIGDIAVVVAPTPELDRVLAMMAQSMPASDEQESYLEGGRVPAKVVERMFRAAEALWRVAPWKVAEDSQIVRVDVPKLGVRGACLSIIGNLGQSFGLLLFPSLDGYEAFGAASERPRTPLDLGTTMLSLEFDRGAALPPSMRREVASHGWPVASPNAYPRVDHRDRDGALRPQSERDVLVMTRVAEALVPFFLTHRDLFASDQASEPACESYFDDDDIEVRLTAPYDAHQLFAIDEPRPSPVRAAEKVPRNAQCPCGSGKKYKKCCLGKDAAPTSTPHEPAHVHESDERIVLEMGRFALQRFGAAWQRSERDFADANTTMQLFVPWSVYCFLVDGRPIVDWYLDERGAGLSAGTRSWLEAQRRSWLGVWEARAVEPGRGITVVDLLSGEQREVHEVTGSRTIKPRDALLGRVVEYDGVSVLCGIHPRLLPPSETHEVLQSARRKLRTKGAVSVDQLRDEPFGRSLIRRWERAVSDMDQAGSVLPTLSNTDGDPLLFTTDHFAFEPARRGQVEERIAGIEGAEPDGGDFVFTAPGNPLHKTWDTTIIGTARLGEDELRIESNSVRRADALRLRVEAACGDLLRHRAREHADPTSSKRPTPKEHPESEIPPEEAARLIREMKEDHYTAWIDQSIPVLKGKTPRQAIRTKAGRARVDLLLKELESNEARFAEAERYDVSRLRTALGLDD